MIVTTLWHYWCTKRRTFSDRTSLEAYQTKRLKQFARRTMALSPYFQPYSHLPFERWPLMNKKIMMAQFDQMNTAGLRRDALLACAHQSEASRDFTPKVGKFSVGLSSGTSGERGLFVVSPREQAIWAGGMLAKMLPDGLLAGERVALFLRANNNLYEAVNSRWLTLRFFDLLATFSQQIASLQRYQPTIVVAPAQVLRALAIAKLEGQLTLEPKKVISVAEVLEPQDRQLIEQAFLRVDEVYQATEGFLAATCRHGTLHLNEEFLRIEPQWLDERRFTPIVTDFTRETQPVIRYQLDDILVKRQTPCPCGNPAMAIEHIEGRCDDQLLLVDEHGNPITLFADMCSRILANTLPLKSDYRLIQSSANQLELLTECELSIAEVCQQALIAAFRQQGVCVDKLHWRLRQQDILPVLTDKRRRIIRLREAIANE